MLRYAVYNKREYVGVFNTYREAREYVNYQFNTCSIKLVIHRAYN